MYSEFTFNGSAIIKVQNEYISEMDYFAVVQETPPAKSLQSLDEHDMTWMCIEKWAFVSCREQ